MPVLQLRLSAEEYAKLAEAAKAAGLPMATFAKRIVVPFSGVIMPKQAMHDHQDVIDRIDSAFHRAPNCSSPKCSRLQQPCCPACQKANAKSFT